jgi:hypothetical protein
LTIWTDDLTTQVLNDRAAGLSHNEIARRHGLTKNKVSGKLWRIDGRKRPPHSNKGRPLKSETQMVANKSPRDSVDRMVFEPYSEFKARRQRERQNAARG